MNRTKHRARVCIQLRCDRRVHPWFEGAGCHGDRRWAASTVTGVALSALLVAAAICLLFASPGIAELAGSKHDFTKEQWSGGSACTPCHVPHRAEQPKTPKWGGTSVIRSSTQGGNDGPGALSRVCLSCHDGNTAGDIVGQAPAGPDMPARSRISLHGSLGTDHPVGVKYPIGQRDFRPQSTLENTEGVRLFNSRVECSSCHDPHNAANQEYLLAMSNEQSRLCLSCHKK